jgi:hypothetical protein
MQDEMPHKAAIVHSKSGCDTVRLGLYLQQAGTQIGCDFGRDKPLTETSQGAHHESGSQEEDQPRGQEGEQTGC